MRNEELPCGMQASRQQNCQLSIVNYQLSTINCQLSTVNYQLSTHKKWSLSNMNVAWR